MWVQAKNIGFASLLLAVTWIAAACNEKKATPEAPKSSKAKTSDAGDSDSDSASADGFDLCSDGLEEASLTGFDSYIKALCGSDPKIDALRESKAVYSGGSEAKIFVDQAKKGATETSVRIYSSTLVKANVKDYWNLLQLQLKKSAAYRENFEYDAGASVSDQKVSDKQVSYRYKNSSETGGAVDYTATTKFITMKAGTAYLTATKLDETNETMQSLSGLIIIHAKSDTATEIFTMSDQTYSHQENQADAVLNEATKAAQDEQKRMYQNAKSADKAGDLLKE